MQLVEQQKSEAHGLKVKNVFCLKSEVNDNSIKIKNIYVWIHMCVTSSQQIELNWQDKSYISANCDLWVKNQIVIITL